MSEKLDVPISGVRLIHEIATGRTSKPIKLGFKPVSAFAANQADSRSRLLTASRRKSFIVWPHQRIMALQHERETRWQKILKLLPGVS
jgi:hypothetical protein